jgi:hypothetical protein
MRLSVGCVRHALRVVLIRLVLLVFVLPLVLLALLIQRIARWARGLTKRGRQP